jgi:hypothetical protein
LHAITKDDAMSDNAVEVFTRATASAFDRRVSVTALGGMILLAAARPLTAAAGKAARKAKKKCKKQVGQCRAFIAERCELISSTPEDEAECVALNDPCCEVFARCHGVSAVQCFAEAAQ